MCGRIQDRPWLRCTNGGALAGIPDGRGTDRLAPPHQPHRLDLLWHGTALRSASLHTAYADYALGGELRLVLVGSTSAWFSSWVWFAVPTLGVFLMLLFPDGRLPSRRWRIVAWVALLGAALVALGTVHAGHSDRPTLTLRTRLRVVGVIGGGLTTYRVLWSLTFLGMTLLLTSSLAALFSLILRLHRARGDERQQIKWFLFAAVPLTVFVA